MGISNRRLEYEKAKEWGDEMDVFVKEETGNWQDPIISTAEVAQEFEMDEEEVIEHLQDSERVMGREIEEGVWVWW
ncbi:hypothetical protein L593_12495 [Salinarchaeum sp. Harcht-Bsk1]|uniref:hypothetical protein n=1 Tax=Salinarchaeum sp. Harcht-Bsk1 TaxID=1333523 RepID=UPI00034243D0|nr:hypothetical protein [Salinarchaeum sp. Harcht-Bsk1]AGN02438.1 hypothetical protein L593_12495 [Salinarchaeum sp. Harcht-Bsk1]